MTAKSVHDNFHLLVVKTYSLLYARYFGVLIPVFFTISSVTDNFQGMLNMIVVGLD